jgi:GNAT superfamily N-acetyltransferase
LTGPLAGADGRHADAGVPEAGADGPLAALLDDVAAGRFPAADGDVTILPQPSPRDSGVIAFTAHSVIFTDADPDWVRGQLTPDDLSAPLLPPFLQAICARTGRRVNNVELLCMTTALSGPPPLALTPLLSSAAGEPAPPAPLAPAAPALPAVPATSKFQRCRRGGIDVSTMPLGAGGKARLERALRYRDDVRAWAAAGGALILGRGVARRWEVSVEVEPDYRGRGLGRDLARAARHLVPGGAPLWAQIAPGNAASVRAFLAAGYQPAGAEALFPLI